LFTEDLGRAKSLYQKIFELQPAHEDETDVMFRLENTLLFLTKSSEAHDARPALDSRATAQRCALHGIAARKRSVRAGNIGKLAQETLDPDQGLLEFR
jgi:hypothetical protein